MEWRRQERLPDAEGLQRKLNEWGEQGWQLVAFEPVRDEHRSPAAGASEHASPTAAYIALLKRRQAACVNIVPGVTSHFWWQDKLEKTDENLLIVKTRENLLPDLIKTVKKLHQNEVPEIIALPIAGGNPDYLAWLDSETA